MKIDPNLVNLVACPICHQKLDFKIEKAQFICHTDKLIFPIKEGIAVLIKENALALEE